MRSYNTHPQVWGGDPSCDHRWQEVRRAVQRNKHGQGATTLHETGPHGTQPHGAQRTPKLDELREAVPSPGDTCARCGAWRGAPGAEPTLAAYVTHLVEVFAAVKRVLRDDGVLFLNLGSAYASSVIESDEYVMREDLTDAERAHVYTELARHFGAQSTALSAVRSADAPAEPDVSRLHQRPGGSPRELRDEGV